MERPSGRHHGDFATPALFDAVVAVRSVMGLGLILEWRGCRDRAPSRRGRGGLSQRFIVFAVTQGPSEEQRKTAH